MRLGALGFFSLAALFVFLKLILAGSYQNKKRLDGSLVAETKIGFTLNRPNVNVVDGLNYTNNLRGGGDASGPSCELQPSFDLLQVGNPEERLVGSNSLDKNLGLLTSTTPRYQVQFLAKQLLEAPDFSYRATSGKNEPCTYSSVHTAAGGPTVHFSGEDLYVTFSSSKFYFGDFSKDNTRFFKRLDYLKRALAVAGNPHSVTYQQNVIVDGVVYSNKIQGDHLEGTRALAANGRTRASAVAVAKPKYLHDLHTETRKQVEQDLIFDAQTESTGTITYVYGNRNKTNLSANHTIETYFFNCKRDSRIFLNKIDDKFFTTDVSRDDYIQAESDLLDLQQTSVLKMCREIGMSSGEMLANQKKRSVMNQCCTDVRRLITDIRSSVENARFSNEVFSVPKAQRFVDMMFNQLTDSRRFVRGVLKFYPAPANVEFHALTVKGNVLLSEQSLLARELWLVAENNGVCCNLVDKAFFTGHSAAQESLIASIALTEIDALGGVLGVDVYEQNTRTGGNRLPTNYSLTEEVYI